MLTLLLGFLSVAAHAEAPLSKHELAEVREGELPAVVVKFTAALEKNPKTTKAFFAFPVAVRETSYKPFGESCTREFAHRKVANMAELNSTLRKLAGAFHADPVRELQPRVYGIATEENCSHLTTIHLDATKDMITELSVDK